MQTVRGPLRTELIGTTLMHEHVFVADEELRYNYPEHWEGEDIRVEEAVVRLKELKSRGVDTIVDCTVIGLGRNVERVARVNEQVDINIIPATGMYTYNELPMSLHLFGPGTLWGGDEPMVDMFVRDITEGIADTGIKAAFLKCAIEDRLTPGVERVMKAVAETHKRTGAPITVHTSTVHRTGLVALEVFRKEGVNLSQVVVGHTGDTTDFDYLHELLDSGAYLGMDRFGLDLLLPTDDRVRTVAALVEQGFADQLVLAHDAACHLDYFPPGMLAERAPNWHLTFIHDTVLPALRDAGVSEAQLTTMLVDNPRRYFKPGQG
ncbi:phosphotriesterase [Streptomyces sp. NPDC090088]|uniref:phosphotriesterase family protein n=1 Tax=Streptomyces sp. NPDC090088 TaxID=3365944 RepID=UPI0037F25688